MAAINPAPGSTGAPATGGTNYVTVTVAPGEALSMVINGFRQVYAAGANVSIPAFYYQYLWRDGVVNALSPNQINGVTVL